MTYSVNTVASLVSSLRAIVKPLVRGQVESVLLRVSVSEDGERTLLLSTVPAETDDWKAY